jgi:hypothetical protein
MWMSHAGMYKQVCRYLIIEELVEIRKKRQGGKKTSMYNLGHYNIAHLGKNPSHQEI